MISLCMIVRNEENFLDGCLKSAYGFFDDIVIVDTGSEDRTTEIALSHRARVFSFPWTGDFSAARNFSAEQAKFDWIFFMDADEVIISFDKEKVNEFTHRKEYVGDAVMRDAESEKKGLYLAERVSRLYNRNYYRFTGKIHEQLRPVDSADVHRADGIQVELLHYGYSPEVMSAKHKLERNSGMLLSELKLDPNNPYLLYQLGKSYFSMDRDINKACEYFEKAIAAGNNLKLGFMYTLVECYGYALLRAGRYNKSLELLKYRDMYGSIPGFRFLLGHIYQNNAKLAEAVECFESCIGQCEGGIGSFISYYNIGVILECIGMTDDAVRTYRKCGDYAPAIGRIKVLENK